MKASHIPFPRRIRNLALLLAPCLLLGLSAVKAAAQATVRADDYHLQLSFDFAAHKLTAVARIHLLPLQPALNATFGLNPNLKVDSVEDQSGAKLSAQRTANGVTITFPSALDTATPITLTVRYSGVLAAKGLSPISGIRTAYVGTDGAFLLYPGQWFPQFGYNTDRFTATIRSTLPAGYGMVASGIPSATAAGGGAFTYTYRQNPASFPGTVVITQLRPQTVQLNGVTENFYFTNDVPASLRQQYAETAARIYSFLAGRFGPPPSNTIHFIELPDDSLPSFSSPNMILLSHNSIGTAVNYRLLTDEIAQQWFGNLVSPATLNDAWIQYGAARFAELLYVQQVAGAQAGKEVLTDLEVGALSYPDIPLSHTAQLYPFSPQFQDLTFDKGAMLFHMLNWVLGDKLFPALQQFLKTNAWKPVTTAQLQAALQQGTGTDLRAFFSEWYEGTGVPAFKNEYVIYRIPNRNAPQPNPKLKGNYKAVAFPTSHFSVTGRLQQNLDLFNMPVQLEIRTDAATEYHTVPVEGTSSSYTVIAQARPRQIIIDPNDWILKSSPDLQVRVFVARGDNLVAAGNYVGAMAQYKDALKVNPISSLADYRIAEADFLQRNWQSAANYYRDALNGDVKPGWIAVWSHLQLGKIFDLTGQRDRAVNEYQMAIQTHDNTANAQVLARQYLQKPFAQK